MVMSIEYVALVLVAGLKGFPRRSCSHASAMRSESHLSMASLAVVGQEGRVVASQHAKGFYAACNASR